MNATATHFAALILPTYNEVENLETVVTRAGAALATTPELARYRIIVVDDQSPDGTGQLADRLAAARDDLEVVHRTTRLGYGAAYQNGFEVARAMGADLILQMDSDLSHDPDDLPRLIAAAAAGADLVIGSRYVPGGGVVDWPLTRRVISRAGSAYARRTLGVRYRDMTGGFRCWRTTLLSELGLERVKARGYSFQIELTYRSHRHGARIVEVPIIFRERVAGKSKMTAGIALEAAHRVPRLRWTR